MVLNKAAKLAGRDTGEIDSLSDVMEAACKRYKDADLVARVRKEDPRATEELVRRYQGKAYAVACQMCAGDREEAMDLTQEAFLKAFRNIKKFNGKSSFYTWFYRILVNTCLDAIKRRTRWAQIFSFWHPIRRDGKDANVLLEDQPDMDKNADPLLALSAKQFKRDVQSIVKALPNKQRMVFQLKVLQEMSISEVAEIMNLAEGTVKSHLFRATQFIRKALKDWAGC